MNNFVGHVEQRATTVQAQLQQLDTQVGLVTTQDARITVDDKALASMLARALADLIIQHGHADRRWTMARAARFLSFSDGASMLRRCMGDRRHCVLSARPAKAEPVGPAHVFPLPPSTAPSSCVLVGRRLTMRARIALSLPFPTPSPHRDVLPRGEIQEPGTRAVGRRIPVRGALLAGVGRRIGPLRGLDRPAAVVQPARPVDPREGLPPQEPSIRSVQDVEENPLRFAQSMALTVAPLMSRSTRTGICSAS